MCFVVSKLKQTKTQKDKKKLINYHWHYGQSANQKKHSLYEAN